MDKIYNIVTGMAIIMATFSVTDMVFYGISVKFYKPPKLWHFIIQGYALAAILLVTKLKG